MLMAHRDADVNGDTSSTHVPEMKEGENVAWGGAVSGIIGCKAVNCVKWSLASTG